MMTDEVHTTATPEEGTWTLRWAKGEPSFGPSYGRVGTLERFFQWRRTQDRLRRLAS